jgi:hypothetical protein|tara:strand:- start:400 stop:618 length:219 start_codon:yes stop_codon:yes gene_type:complete
MSKIKEQMIGYEVSDWIEPQAHVMVDELIEYQIYCMTMSEITQRVTKQMKDDYYSNPYSEMTQQYREVFHNE